MQPSLINSRLTRSAAIVAVLWAVAFVGQTASVAPSVVSAAEAGRVDCAAGALADPTRPAADPKAMASFTATTPERIIDTRDGTGGVIEAIGAGCALSIDLAATGVASDASAVALSITAISSEPGFLSVFACADGRPATSNLNMSGDGFPTPGLVIALPDQQHRICVYSLASADVLVDVTGWWTPTGPTRFRSITPLRVDDSREDPDGARLPAFTPRWIDVDGQLAGSPRSVVANLTVTQPAADGFLVAYPCDGDPPVASNLNVRAGETRAVAAVVGLDPVGALCVLSNVDTHVVVDITGYYEPTPQFGPAASLHPSAGDRLADSRDGTGGWNGRLGAADVRRLRPLAGLPDESQATAVAVNVVAVGPDEPGFVSVYPCGGPPPNASTLNVSPGRVSTNVAIVDLSASGEICFFTSTPVDLVVDLFGVVAAEPGQLVERLAFDGFTWPPYSTSGTDYGVECGSWGTALDLDLLGGTAARVNGVPVASGSIDLPLGPESLTSVRLERSGVTRTMWFRCLPAGFPRLDVRRTTTPADGWYLTAVGSPTATFALILDEYGAPIWYKQVGHAVLDLKRRSDGRLLLTPELGPRYGVDPQRGYELLSLNGTVLQTFRTVDDPSTPGTTYPTDHHDLALLPNGGRAQLSYPVLADQDLSALGGGFTDHEPISDGVIQEFSATGELTWTWRTSEHFAPVESPYPIRWGAFPTYAGTEVDLFHLNSLEAIDDGSGDFLVSARHLDAVFRVDRATSDVAWILGSLPAATPNLSGAPRLTVVGDPLGGPRRPHDARLHGDVLTLLDNRTDMGQAARAVAYRIDEQAGTATLLWQLDNPSATPTLGLGSNRVSPDGSVLVNWGAGTQPMITEYDAAHTELMRISQVGGGAVYRIVKEPPGSFSAAVLRALSGGMLDEG